MKLSLNVRKILTVATVADVMLVLAILGLPNVFENSFGLLSLTFSLAPLLVLLTFISYVVGRTPDSTTRKQPSKKILSAAAIITLVSIALSIAFTLISTHISLEDYAHNKFAYENIGTGFMFIAYVSAIVLINSQRFVYWPFWSRSDKAAADERQKFVRQRVFEKAYRYIIVIGLAMLWLREPGQQRIDQFLALSFALALVALPSIIATRQSDS